VRIFRIAIDLAVLGLALGCGAAALAAQGGRWVPRLDLLTHPAPLWLVGGLAALGLSLVVSIRPLRVATAVFAVAAVVSSLTLMWSDLARMTAPRSAPLANHTLKLVEVNAWGRNPDVGRVVRLIQDEDPDVAIIVEASPALNQELRASTNLHVFAGAGATIATREKPTHEDVAWGARDLPGGPTEFSWVNMWGGGTPFTVIGVHCRWPIPHRMAEAQDLKLTSLTGQFDRTELILTGDFNSTQWSFRQKAADQSFGLERRDLALPTWPARLPTRAEVDVPLPFLSIDHVYAGSEWRTVSVRRGPRVGSDHYPLIAILTRDAPLR
jgi:endonuclease/exonuclease/phosphatase (EEP) superfamily protein YafD